MAADSSPLPRPRSASALGSKSLGCHALGYFGATVALAAAVASVAGVGAARAQEKGYGQTISSPQQERGDIKGAQESLALARSRKPGPSDPRRDQVAAAWGLAPLRDPSPLPQGKPTPALQAESGNP